MKRIVLIFIATACTALGLYAQPAPTYTLKSCLEQGLLNNYSLRIVRNEEQVSKNNATLGNAGYLPTLDLSAGYKGTIDNTETKARATGETTKDNGVFDQTLDAGINLNWTIFDGFNITANYQRLKELERQGETNTRIAIEDLIANIAAEYYNYVQQKIRLKNFRYAVSLSKERLRIVENDVPLRTEADHALFRVVKHGLDVGAVRLLHAHVFGYGNGPAHRVADIHGLRLVQKNLPAEAADDPRRPAPAHENPNAARHRFPDTMPSRNASEPTKWHISLTEPSPCGRCATGSARGSSTTWPGPASSASSTSTARTSAPPTAKRLRKRASPSSRNKTTSWRAASCSADKERRSCWICS